MLNQNTVGFYFERAKKNYAEAKEKIKTLPSSQQDDVANLLYQAELAVKFWEAQVSKVPADE